MIKKIGKHRIKHGDIMDGIDDLMQGDKADFIYTDPPWGQGTLKYFQTLNKKQTGKEPKDVSWSGFMDLFFSILSNYAKDGIVIEMGTRWRDDVISHSEKSGFIHGGVLTSLYGSKKKPLPLDLHLLSKSGSVEVNPIMQRELLKQWGFNVVDFMFDEFCPDAGVILDPMCGMGYTAKATIKRGLAFYGNEINSKRLNQTVEKLQADSNQ